MNKVKLAALLAGGIVVGAGAVRMAGADHPAPAPTVVLEDGGVLDFSKTARPQRVPRASSKRPDGGVMTQVDTFRFGNMVCDRALLRLDGGLPKNSCWPVR